MRSGRGLLLLVLCVIVAVAVAGRLWITRRSAPGESTSPPAAFWSAFIVELGRRAHTHEPYDLLGTVDPAATQLDVVQIAFITKRLAGDLGALARAERAQALPVGPAVAARWPHWMVQPVFAQPSPCQFTDQETEILDWTALVPPTPSACSRDGWEIGASAELARLAPPRPLPVSCSLT